MKMLHQAVDVAAPAFPASLLDLVARAQRSVEVDPGLTRHYLDEISGLLLGGAEEAAERALVPRLAPSAGETASKGGLAAWQIRRVRDYVEQKLDETILVDDLATVARLSAGHFCRAFKISVGETPHAYIIRQRVRRAQVLMLKTNETLSHIACACGLTDQAHLTRLFRRLVNETPLAWRRTWRAA
jgi:AraC family transcriptional regulator